MFKGLGNIASLMRNASEISGKFAQVSEELKQKRATGEAGGGMVKVEVNGLGQVLAVTIEVQLFEAGEYDLIQNLLPAAFNQAAARARQMHVEAMKSLTGGISLPGLDNILDHYSAHDTTGDPESPDQNSGQ